MHAFQLIHQAQNKHRVIYGAREDTLHIFTPFTKTHIHLNDVTYHIAQQKEPREGHSHRPSSEMVPSTYRRLSRQSLPQMFPNKGSRISRHPPWEPGTCIRMAVRPPASLPPTPPTLPGGRNYELETSLISWGWGGLPVTEGLVQAVPGAGAGAGAGSLVQSLLLNLPPSTSTLI